MTGTVGYNSVGASLWGVGPGVDATSGTLEWGASGPAAAYQVVSGDAITALGIYITQPSTGSVSGATTIPVGVYTLNTSTGAGTALIYSASITIPAGARSGSPQWCVLTGLSVDLSAYVGQRLGVAHGLPADSADAGLVFNSFSGQQRGNYGGPINAGLPAAWGGDLSSDSISIYATVGTLGAAAALAGDAAGAASATGSLSTGINMAGDAAGQATATGELTEPAALAGAATGNASASGAMITWTYVTVASPDTGPGSIFDSRYWTGAPPANGDLIAYDATGGFEVLPNGQYSAPGYGSWFVQFAYAATPTAWQLSTVSIVQTDFAGDAAGVASATGSLSTGINMAGDAAGQATASGTIGNDVSLAGDAAGNATATGAVTTGDVVAPTLSTATIAAAGTSITLAFSESVTFGAGSNTGFALTPTNGGAAVTLTYASGSGSSSLVYSTSRTIKSTEVLTLAYTQPGNGVEDAAGNDLVSFSGQSVTNSSTQNAAPTDISLSSTTTTTGSGLNATVGTLSTTDPDAGDTFTYSLVAGTGDTNNASFNISGSSLRCNDPSALGIGTYSVRIQTSDGVGTFAKAVSVQVVASIPMIKSTITIFMLS